MNQTPIQIESNQNLPAENKFDTVITHLAQSSGIPYTEAANLLSHAIKSCIPVGKIPTSDWEFISSLLSSFEPQNVQEAMLAVQMIGVHYQTTDLLSKATKYDSINIKEQYLKLAAKLSRLYATQLETLKKFRSKGEQRMVVEHVHIHNGGQAILGQVTTEKHEGTRG